MIKSEEACETSSTQSFEMSETNRSGSEATDAADEFKEQESSQQTERSDSKISICLPPIEHVLQTIDDYQNQQKLQDSELLLAFRERHDSSEFETEQQQPEEDQEKPRSSSIPAQPEQPIQQMRMSHSVSMSQLPTTTSSVCNSSVPFNSEGITASGKLVARPQRSYSYSNVAMPEFKQEENNNIPSRASSIGSTDSAPSTGANTPNSTQSGSSASANSKKRTNLPRETIDILNEWIVNNLDNPYPNHTQKRMLLEKTGLSNVQLSNWFINKRRRRLFSNLSGNQGYPIKKKRLIDRI
jgi:hypothetical protein